MGTSAMFNQHTTEAIISFLFVAALFSYRSLCLQATGSDQLIGCMLVAVAALVFTYYTIWVVVLVSTCILFNYDQYCQQI